MRKIEIIPGCVDYVPDFIDRDFECALFDACMKMYDARFRTMFDPWRGNSYAPTNFLPHREVMRLTDHWDGGSGEIACFIEALRVPLKSFDVNVNQVLINLYKNGSESLGYHRDTEPELADGVPILTLSLNRTRRMELRPQSDTSQLIELNLEPRSLVVMKGRCQLDWYHGILEEPGLEDPRISLTFRQVTSL